MGPSVADAGRWASLMGRDLERADLQPLQPVRIRKDRSIEVSAESVRAIGLSEGAPVAVHLDEGRCVLRQDGEGFSREPSRTSGRKALRLPVSEDVENALASDGAAALLLVGREGEGRILPLDVAEHPPDVLGPRFIDELREGRVVRHAVPGLARDGWTDEALGELEALLCCEPFRVDPVAAVADGDDWVAWMTRNRVLGRPAPGDDRLREGLIADVFRAQRADGSWGAVPATAYAVLRGLRLGLPPDDPRLRRAAQWLLDAPEPPPRPGAWMLTEAFLREWLAKRRPEEGRALAACEILRVPPDESINFFSWAFPDVEQDQFRGQAMQQVVPTCARHHPPACEPRITHVSALVAEALLRCGYADRPRLRRYVNTVFHLGGQWGYWCGCGALGLFDADIPASQAAGDFNLRAAADDGAADLSPWRWVADAAECVGLANQPIAEERGTGLEPFAWGGLPDEDGAFALVGTGWQNGDCWAKTNRALSRHPACRGSLAEQLALFQASRYQTSLGEWDQAFPAGMLAFLVLYDHPVARSLAVKTVPWLRAHQGDDGLWHHEALRRNDWGKPAHPPQPRLATYHIVAALAKFGLLSRLRP